MLDITRNQWFAAGVVIVLLGIQFRMVESYELTSEATRILARQTGHPVAALNDSFESLTGRSQPMPKATLRPPEWLGWSLLSLGAVLILHSMAMRKPD